MATLLTICQNVANAIPLAKPLAIVGSSNDTARLLLAMANQEGQSLYRHFNWSALNTEYTFTTTAGTADYALPSDFGRVENSTVWDRSNYEETRGPLTPQEWQAYKSSILGNTPATWKKWRIRNVSGTRVFSLYPTPTDSGETLVFEYISKNWCASSGGTGQDAFSADSDTFLLDDHLLEMGVLCRILKRMGFAYEDELTEYQMLLDAAVARDRGSRVLAVGGQRHNVHLIDGSNIPETGFGS